MNMKPRSSRSAKAIERNELQRQARLKAVQDALPPEQRLNARTDWDDPVFKPYALPPKHARAAMRQEMAEQAADNQDRWASLSLFSRYWAVLLTIYFRQKATVNANVNKAGANDTGALRKGVCQCCTLINPGEHNKASRDDIPILTKQDFLNDKTDATWEKFKRDTYMVRFR